AIKQEINTSNANSLESICHRWYTEAPNTLRTPISFLRCSATNDARPNNPRHEIKVAKIVKNVASLPSRCWSSNFLAYISSLNLKSNGAPGLYFLNTASILFNASATGTAFLMATVTMPTFSGLHMKIVGVTGLYGDSIIISFTTPTT